MKKNIRYIFILCALVVVGMGKVWAVEIVGYSLAVNFTTTSSKATSGLPVNSASTITGVGINTNNCSTDNGMTSYSTWNSMGNDCWKTSTISTSGYISIAVAFQMKSTATGPGDFKVQYSFNGTSWTDVPNDENFTDDNPLIETTTLQADYYARLPAVCDNKANLYIRWVQNSTLAQNNGAIGTNSSATSSLKGVSVQGELFVAPTTQASVISIVSVTSNTITVGCTRGSGNRRVLVMNTEDVFTTPTDNTNPTANTTYSGSGQQVIYNGTGTAETVTINMPLTSSSTFWFRYYDYNMMDALTKFFADPASGNPKECSLETIHSPTASFGLTRATLGATITEPISGTIVERGIFWSLDPGVNTGSNQSAHPSTSGGAFTYSLDGGVDRGSIIYYKGYVVNQSGTIMTDEASFDNRPIFTGTGNWEDATKWNVQEVPGANGDATYGSVDDSPFINGDCTLTASNSCNILTINSGNKLTIQPEKSLTVVGDLINYAGTSGLVIKASSTTANGSLIFPQSSTVPATVEMYSKASWNASLSNTDNSKYKWQYFGIPVSTLPANPTFYGGYVRYWDETGDSITNHWKSMNTFSTLYPFTGYEICQLNPKTYSFVGDLVNSDFSKIDLAYTASALYPGQHIYANPYTAAINISALANKFGTNMEEAVYLYNAGSYSQWEASSGATTYNQTTTTPGQYTVSTPLTADGSNIGVPTQIPSMQAFLVKAISNTPANNSLIFNYADVVGANTELQRAPSANKAAVAKKTKVGMRIDVIGTHYSDKMWIFTDSTCTRKYDRGWDGSKLFGSPRTPQLFAIETDGNYQINAVADMNNTDLGFQAGDDKEFTMRFTHENTDKKYANIYLLDMIAKTTTDITISGSEYKFTAVPNGKAEKRFKIITRSLNDNATDDATRMKIYSANGVVFVQNNSNEAGEVKLYNMAGKLVKQFTYSANNITSSFVNLSSGVYLAKTLSNGNETSSRIIVP